MSRSSEELEDAMVDFEVKMMMILLTSFKQTGILDQLGSPQVTLI
jgi:hypothetical protein